MAPYHLDSILTPDTSNDFSYPDSKSTAISNGRHFVPGSPNSLSNTSSQFSAETKPVSSNGFFRQGSQTAHYGIQVNSHLQGDQLHQGQYHFSQGYVNHPRSDRPPRSDNVRYLGHGSHENPLSHGIPVSSSLSRQFVSNDARGFGHRKGKKGHRGQYSGRGGYVHAADGRHHDRRVDLSGESRPNGEMKGSLISTVDHSGALQSNQLHGTNLDTKNFPPLRADDSPSVNCRVVQDRGRVLTATGKIDDEYDDTKNVNLSAFSEKPLSPDCTEYSGPDVETKLSTLHLKKDSELRIMDNKRDHTGLSYAAILRTKTPSARSAKIGRGDINEGTDESPISEATKLVASKSSIGSEKPDIDSRSYDNDNNQGAIHPFTSGTTSGVAGTSEVKSGVCVGSNLSGEGRNGFEIYDGKKGTDTVQNGEVFSLKDPEGDAMGMEDFQENDNEEVVGKSGYGFRSKDSVSDQTSDVELFMKTHGEHGSSMVRSNKPQAVAQSSAPISSEAVASPCTSPTHGCDDNTDRVTVVGSSAVAAHEKVTEVRKCTDDGENGIDEDINGGAWVKAGRKYWTRQHGGSLAHDHGGDGPQRPRTSDISCTRV